MKKAILIIATMLLVLGCGTTKYVPIQNNTVTNYKDSTVLRYKDTTIVVEIPREVIRDVVPQYDTLYMETYLSKASAYVDTTTHTLKGSLENKTENALQKIIYLPSEEHVVYKDSLVTKEVPVEVTVEKTHYPKTYWPLLGFFILALIGIGIRVYLKIKTGK